MKKVISLFMAFIMLLSITAGIDMASYATNGIETKISSIKSKYPNGSYFSKNGKACSHEQWQTCNNCRLSSISSAAANICGDSWTCQAFARYVFYMVFNKSPYSSSNTKKTVSASSLNSSASYGDFVECVSSSGAVTHAFIFLGASGTKHYRYQSNYGAPNKVSYKTVSASGEESPATTKYKIYHASNYNEINNGSSSTTKNVTISFNVNGGLLINGSNQTGGVLKKTYTVGNKYGINIPSAVKYGYSFVGWYTQPTGGIRHDRNTTVSANVTTLYAHYEKHEQGALKHNGIYRIYNYGSNLPIQASSSSINSKITQENYSDSKSQLWRVIDCGEYGYYFLSLNGGNHIEVACGDDFLAMKNPLILDTHENVNVDQAGLFTLHYESTRDNRSLYSIHCRSGRTVDVSDDVDALKPGAAVYQYEYNGDNNQLFYFEEVTDRSICFYDNITQNYLPTPKDVYDYSESTTPTDGYLSRNTDIVTTTVDPQSNTLIIDAKKTGSASDSLTFTTSVNGSKNYDIYDLNNSAMYLYFTAKSSVEDVNMYFRWGYDSTDNCKYVTLSKAEKTYMVELPRTWNSGSNIHPWIDTACNIEMSNIYLTEEKIADISELPLLAAAKTDAFNNQARNYDVSQNNGNYGYLPEPVENRVGYTFAGWYTKRVGGDKVTEGTPLQFNTKLYAHWEKKILNDVEITENPIKTVYEIGESLDTTGLRIKLNYNDGSSEIISSGFTTSGFSSTTAGTKTVTVSYGGKTTSFNVIVKNSVVEENAPYLTMDSIVTSAGKEITLSLNIKNNPGIAGLAISLIYDEDVFTLKDVKNGNLFDAFTYGKNFVWDDSQNITSDGTLATFVFSVSEDAEAGDYIFEIISRSCVNIDLEDVELLSVNPTVTVSDFIYGDTNGDGSIDMKDVVLLRKYMANYDYDTESSSEVVEPGADANGDSNIDMKDVVLLRKYLANYDYDTGSSSVVLGPQ